MSFNQDFQNIILDITDNGQLSQPRDLQVKELTVSTYKFDPTKTIANFNSRSFNWKYFAGELVWYLNKDRNIQYISNFSNFWSNITNPYTKEINSNYGSLLFGDQLNWALNSLIQDKNSRQAIAFLNQPKFQFPSNKDFVCTMYLNFFIRDNKLNMKVQMRSNDIFYGLTFDAPFFSFVHQHMRLWLLEKYPDLELGTYYHCADNIHFYERHFELAENILTETEPAEQYQFNITEPFFRINETSYEMELTKHGRNYIDNVNKALECSVNKSGYYNILKEYINIEIL